MQTMKKILVVDDAPENVLVLGRILMGHHEVLVATRGQDALAIARTQCPDLILLDLQMPGMDGYEVMLRLRESPETERIPVIMVTVDQSDDSRNAAYEAGARGFIEKPVDCNRLLAEVASVLEEA